MQFVHSVSAVPTIFCMLLRRTYGENQIIVMQYLAEFAVEGF